MMDSKTGEENNTDQSNCPKKSRKTSLSNYVDIESLPVDVIFEVLVRVPAQDIYNSTRLVCRKWYMIINTHDFKNAHLHRSTCVLLAHDRSLSSNRHQLTFIATGSKADDLIEMSKLSYQTRHLVLSSCNGLVLAARDYRYVYITNPITKQNLDLPPFFSNNTLPYASAIAYVATTMEYKVVRSLSSRDCKLESQDDCVAILTLGVDKDWTCRVNTQHLSLQAKKLLKILHPLTTQGFVHWARDDGMVTWAGYERRSKYVLTLNVETEIITQFPVPSLRCKDGLTEVKYLPMGSYLSLLILRSEFSWEFWEMKPETGEWTEMPSIDLEAQFASSRNNILKPVGWLRPREVLVFNVRERIKPSRFDSFHRTPFCFAFTVRTRKLQKFKLDDWVNRCLVHVNSLVWIDGC